MLRMTIVVVLVILLAACGRVSTADHEAVLHELEDTQIELADTERQRAELEAEVATLNQRIEELQEERASLKSELEVAKGDLELYESRKGSLEEALEANREELNELREARRQTEKRLQEYRQVAAQLASMVEAGQLSVTIRDGRMVINLDNEILFASGRKDIQQEGQEALRSLAGVLQDIEGRNFLVAGHTDNVPISSARFNSNWELSTARAVEVVQFLQGEGVSPGVLAAAGYGEYDPIASNEEPETRALNRRIEIILMPSIHELPALPDDLFEES